MNRIMALSGAPAGRPAADSGPARALPSDTPLTVDIRPLAACADIADAWSQLAVRALEANPFFEPGFLLAACQHLVSFRDAVVILVWQGGQHEPGRRLVGLIPCCRRRGLFVPDALIGLSDRRVVCGAPLLDRQSAEAVIEAVLDPRRQHFLEGHGLVLRGLDLDGPLVSMLRDVAGRTSLNANVRPRLSAGISAPRPDMEAARRMSERQGKLALIEPRTQAGLRDAVEIILAMEASGPRAQAGLATLQDTREVGFLRAMTRSLGHVRQCRVGLLMRDNTPIAGAIVIGRGPRSWLYLGAQDEAEAALRPQAILLAMMRQAAPARSILLPDGRASDGEGHLSLAEVQLSHGPLRRPRDLAKRAREALQRSFRLPRVRLPRVRPPRVRPARVRPPRAGGAG